MNVSNRLAVIGILLKGFLLLACGPTLAQSSLDAALEAAGDHFRNHRAAEADAAYQELVQRNPENPAVLTQYGAFKRLWGEYTEAIPMLQQAVELAPEDGFALYQLGIAYRFSGRYGAASFIFRRLIGMAPDGAPAYHQLASTELARGNRDEALRHVQVAERLFGDAPPDWRLAQLASIYGQLGRRNDAQRLFDALSRKSDASHASLALGNIAIGDYGQALEHLRSAVSAPQSVPGAINVLSQLRANPFGDPALAGPAYQGVLSGLGHP